MSMSLVLLCILIFSNTSLAGPQPVTTPARTIILSDFISHLPSCASQCIDEFISESFPNCLRFQGYQNLACLCPSQSGSGLTLGEGALRCLVSSCTAATSTDIDAAYQVCAEVPHAQVPTHTVLSAPIATPTTISVHSQASRTSRSTRTQSSTKSKSTSTTTKSHSSRTSMHTSSSATTTNVTLDSSAASSTMPFGSSSTFSVASTSAAPELSSGTAAKSTAAASSSASPAPILNKAQIAGIAVAGSLVGAVAFGLIFFLFCVRRRRNRRRDSDASFGTSEEYSAVGGAGNSTSTRPAMRQTQAFPAIHEKRFVGVPGGPSHKRWTAWKNAMSKAPPQPEIGLAISPAGRTVVTHESSPISVKSYHTTSNLLPDKPMLKKFTPPNPIQFTKDPRQEEVLESYVKDRGSPGIRLIAPTPPPKSERRRWNEENTSQVALQKEPPRPPLQIRTKLSDPFIDNQSDPRAMMYAMERQRASNKDLPRIIMPAERDGPYTGDRTGDLPRSYPHLASLVPAPLNPASYTSPRSPITPLLPSPNIQVNKQQQPGTTSISAPASIEPGTNNGAISKSLSDRSQLPSQSQPQFNKFLPIKSSRRASTKRPETYYTTGSETSFEDEFDESPPEPPAKHASSLSPVAESPASHGTPLSRVRYPQVPGSSAERTLAAARSPESYFGRRNAYEVSPLSSQPRGSPGAARNITTPKPAVLPSSRGIVELPERSSSRRGVPTNQPRGHGGMPNISKQEQKFQISYETGLDGKTEVSGSPTTPNTTRQRQPKTPPEWKAGRQLHSVPKGQWID